MTTPAKFSASDSPSDNLLEQYIAGASPSPGSDEAAALSADDRLVADALRRLGVAGDLVVASAEVDAAWQRVTMKAQTVERPSARKKPMVRPVRQWWSFASTTVAVAALVLAGWLAWDTVLFNPASGQPTQYTTGNSQQATVSLPDGSKVLLNVASRLTVPADFGRASRTVSLEGQALFTVTQHAGKPFLVDVNGTHAQVLGTEFSVRSYNPDSVVLAVASGKVQLANTIVSANEVARMATGANPVLATGLTDAELSFAKRQLNFVRTPMLAVIPAANRWYDIDLQLGDPSLANVQLTGQFAGAVVSDFTHALETILPVRVERRGKTIVLYPIHGARQ